MPAQLLHGSTPCICSGCGSKTLFALRYFGGIPQVPVFELSHRDLDHLWRSVVGGHFTLRGVPMCSRCRGKSKKLYWFVLEDSNFMGPVCRKCLETLHLVMGIGHAEKGQDSSTVIELYYGVTAQKLCVLYKDAMRFLNEQACSPHEEDIQLF